MGSWGVKSYENDAAAEALDAAFEEVHGLRYAELMDDRDPMTFDQVQETLASPETLYSALGELARFFGSDPDKWDEETRLAFAGVVVRHAEFGVPIDDVSRDFAIGFLEGEEIEWPEATLRRLRREKEIAMLRATS